jgi:hypothetical protein
MINVALPEIGATKANEALKPLYGASVILLGVCPTFALTVALEPPKSQAAWIPLTGVGLGTGVGVGLGVAVGTEVGAAVGTGLGVAVGFGVAVGAGVGDAPPEVDGAPLGVAVGFGVDVGAGVALGGAEALGVAVTVGVAVGAAVTAGVAVATGVAVGVGVGVPVGNVGTTTPLGGVVGRIGTPDFWMEHAANALFSASAPKNTKETLQKRFMNPSEITRARKIRPLVRQYPEITFRRLVPWSSPLFMSFLPSEKRLALFST